MQNESGRKGEPLERQYRWMWNGQIWQFDITEPEHMGRLILGLTALKMALAELQGDTDADLALAAHSEILQGFFDLVLGEGMGEKVCGHSCSSAYALAYLDFMECISAQLQWLEEQLDVAEQRYRMMGAALGWVAREQVR